MKKVLRFVGDWVGYVVDWDEDGRPKGWLTAEIGSTGRKVLVHADLAYVIEDLDSQDPL